MKLLECLKDLDWELVKGDVDRDIAGITYDSRLVRDGYLFVAVRGHEQDGHDFILNAIENGASAVVVECTEIDLYSRGNNDVSLVKVDDSRKALSQLAVNFYKRPFETLKVIGITGTNGKTTTSYILESILLSSGATPGVIGTINYRYAGLAFDSSVTTPESSDLMAIFRNMADKGVSHVIMEVSSHALEQGRIDGCPIDVAVFTNLSRDHLDYHGTMDRYFDAKRRLFTLLKNGRKDSSHVPVAVVNMDDPRGKDLLNDIDCLCITYGRGGKCDVRAESVDQAPDGLTARLVTPKGDVMIRSRLKGLFNIYNILAATAVSIGFGLEWDHILKGISSLESVPGRMEFVPNRLKIPVIVDYAHTPDALFKVIQSARAMTSGRLITLFGCGGDRDRGKRPEMGIVAGTMSDMVIVTSDNPRNEDPLSIMEDIAEGIRRTGMKELDIMHRGEKGFLLESDRKKAISLALEMADREDLVLIAGKGHEDYQIVGNDKHPFDDRKEVALAAEALIK